MSINATLTASASPFRYSIETIKDEVRQLVERGIIKKNQPLYALCQYLPAREWLGIESELERCDYLLRDRISDLLSTERWDND
ncbi:hypothetical protein Sta7437_2797 [Stanieria cyanosphaera PCC 7437]|uniref:DUF4327 domain-containing protein n=1 Tax=Stanieria cyanosphaera (strain ATCC 29371 / PCC 7437) TaxID=111780 RepID=K9XW61_STAC7|nr:DUF4327 family protein [Stanieria cyanosphaera]AFZ36321.1 hypothetical protein Sta7437_2797 [Stanieria cyanosphaera PCC 7437]